MVPFLAGLSKEEKRKETAEWYENNWTSIASWVTELSSAACNSIFIENFLDEIPKGIDKDYLCMLFNADGNGFWRMCVDSDNALVIHRK